MVTSKVTSKKQITIPREVRVNAEQAPAHRQGSRRVPFNGPKFLTVYGSLTMGTLLLKQLEG